MDELIARLEKATGPDRKLDAAIASHLGKLAIVTDNAGLNSINFAADFTASIDAALTLVPEGWRWRVEDFNVNPMPRAELAEVGQIMNYGIGIKHRAQADGATPAIALCIAALMARHATAPRAPAADEVR